MDREVGMSMAELASGNDSSVGYSVRLRFEQLLCDEEGVVVALV